MNGPTIPVLINLKKLNSIFLDFSIKRDYSKYKFNQLYILEQAKLI